MIYDELNAFENATKGCMVNFVVLFVVALALMACLSGAHFQLTVEANKASGVAPIKTADVAQVRS